MAHIFFHYLRISNLPSQKAHPQKDKHKNVFLYKELLMKQSTTLLMCSMCV